MDKKFWKIFGYIIASFAGIATIVAFIFDYWKSIFEFISIIFYSVEDFLFFKSLSLPWFLFIIFCCCVVFLLYDFVKKYINHFKINGSKRILDEKNKNLIIKKSEIQSLFLKFKDDNYPILWVIKYHPYQDVVNEVIPFCPKCLVQYHNLFPSYYQCQVCKNVVNIPTQFPLYSVQMIYKAQSLINTGKWKDEIESPAK